MVTTALLVLIEVPRSNLAIFRACEMVLFKGMLPEIDDGY